MPYEWSHTPEPELRLWRYHSLSSVGFGWFIGVTAALIALPLVTMLGSAVWWGLLPFIAAALWAIWFAIRHNQTRGETEVLHLRPDLIRLQRRSPGKTMREWEANPHWVQINLYPTSGPVPQYLTLRGNGREVELGAFLSEDERLRLRDELELRLRALH